mgnify:CR=1 FL=1
MTAPELLPCPFCGGEASHNGGGGSCFGRFWWIVGCKTCDIWVSDPEIWDKKNPGMLDPAYPAKWCIAAWNRRTTSPEVAALIAEARREGWNAAIEAAEKACDPSSYQAYHASVRRRCQTAIRALKEETT